MGLAAAGEVEQAEHCEELAGILGAGGVAGNDLRGPLLLRGVCLVDRARLGDNRSGSPARFPWGAVGVLWCHRYLPFPVVTSLLPRGFGPLRALAVAGIAVLVVVRFDLP